MKTLDVVIPVYNEVGSIAKVCDEVESAVAAIHDVSIRLIIVDDGSEDGTRELLKEISAKRDTVSAVGLCRNFGKEAAILAGIQHSRADAVVVMDGDLQHPPRLVSDMIVRWQEGYAIVEAVKRREPDEAILSKIAAGAFYRLFKAFSGLDLRDYSDFKLLDRRLVDLYLAMPEHGRFFRGLVKWMGFEAATISFEVEPRASGTSSWRQWKLIRYSLSAVTSFSSAPLQLVTLLGFLTFVVSIVFGGIALYDKLIGKAIGGFTTVIILLLFVSSVLMFSLGLIGTYIARIYDEVKRRPQYLVAWKAGSLAQSNLRANE